MKRIILFLALASIALSACRRPQPTYVRGDDHPGIDDPAMSTGLDQRDIQRLFNENMASMVQSRWYNQAAGASYENQPTVAVMPFENMTTEYVEPSLHALIGFVETELVNSGRFAVIAAPMRQTLLDELNLQQGAAFDQSRAVPLGRQLGVHYFVTGRVVDNSERTATARRVQYSMFMQAISVETGQIVWQNSSMLTKGIIPL